jgi:hypothetical protein
MYYSGGGFKISRLLSFISRLPLLICGFKVGKIGRIAVGMGGRIQSERVDDLRRNQWRNMLGILILAK